jgi:long-subunit fatty acid transport protein
MLCSAFAFSQEIKFGAKVGLNISSLRGNYPAEIDETKSKIGFHIGGFAEYSINDKFALQPELLLSTQGGSSEVIEYYGGGTYFESFKQTPKLTYINLPIMLKYKVIEKLSIEFGPQIGYLISAKSKWEYVDSTDPSENETIEVDLINDGTYTFGGTTVQVKPKTNRLDFGLNIGSSYDVTDKFFVQARYNLGLTVLDKNSTAGSSTNSWDLKNSVIQISTGYRF